ncbi:EpsG family protein [Limnobaculum zhutongyuii]|uniref:EpsG family protein n=1 Tax=Limnobaculum zhutongyuii TaxID=2498113 RepID=UPI002AC3663F|nr:EpsG family protein [Limnobaculum zhutongyuii]
MLFFNIFIFYFLFFISLVLKNKSANILLFFAMFPMAFIVVFRGDVGVDTATYIQLIQYIQDTPGYTNIFEPFFELLIYVFSIMGLNAREIVSLLSVITIIILLYSSYKIEKRLVIFSSCIVPMFFFDMTMNGIRYGLSFSIILLGLSFLIRNRSALFWMCILLSSLIQFSGALLGLLVYFLYTKRIRVFIYSLLLLIPLLFVFSGYLINKVEAYQGAYVSSGLSGVSTLLITLLVLFTWCTNKDMRYGNLFVLLTIFSLTLLSYVLAQYTYAGLRVQNIVAYTLFLMIMVNFKQLSHTDYKIIFLLFFIGLISFAFKMKNFYDGEGIGLSPFVPYHFYWDI